jgi:ribonuclease P protein component
MQLRSRHGFARAMRLSRERDVQRVLRQGSRARAAHLVVAVVPNGLGHTRLGISIGKRIERSAVKRNRLRRIVREAFRLSYAELPSGLDVLVLGAEPRVKLELAATRAELVMLVRKAERRWREKEAARVASAEQQRAREPESR